MAHAAGAPGGSMMSQLVQGMARKALQQQAPALACSQPQHIDEPQGACDPGQLHSAVRAAEQLGVFDRLRRVEESIAALAAAAERVEARQQVILQGQRGQQEVLQAIMNRLSHLERRRSDGLPG